MSGMIRARPDQAHVPPQQSTVSPGGKAVIRAREVIIFGANGGLFVYSAAPAAGKLIASIADANGTDPYGNAYLKGVTTYANPGFTTIPWLAQQQATGITQWYQAATSAGPWSENDTAGNLMPGFTIAVASEGGASIQWAQSVQTPALVDPAAPLLSQNPRSATTAAETWHAMGAMSNSWSIGGFAQYRLTALGDLQVAFQDLVPGTDADGTTIWAAGTFPTAYRVPANHRLVAFADILRQPSAGIFGSAGLQFQTDGSVQCFGVAAAATRVDLYATIPLSV